MIKIRLNIKKIESWVTKKSLEVCILKKSLESLKKSYSKTTYQVKRAFEIRKDKKKN